MNGRDWLPRFSRPKEVAGASREMAVQYGIPYEWGALHVTKPADEAYGFVPLTPDVITNGGIDISKTKAAGLRTDVYLLGPDEFIEKADIGKQHFSNAYKADLAAVGAVSLRKNGIVLRLALTKDADSVKDRMLSSMALLAEQTESDLDDLRTKDGIPLKEAIAHQTPQTLLEALCIYTADVTREAAADFFTGDLNRKILRRSSRLGAFGLAASGVLMSTNAALRGSIDPLVAASALTYTGYYSFLARQAIKRHLKNAAYSGEMIRKASFVYAGTIAEDLYRTYCSAHFDRQAEAMLKDD